MYRLESASRENAEQIPSRHPEVIGFESLTANDIADEGKRLAARGLDVITTYLWVTYDLFFESVLIETAHADIERRQDYLLEE